MTSASRPSATSPSRPPSPTCSSSTRCSAASAKTSRSRTGRLRAGRLSIPLLTGKDQPAVPALGRSRRPHGPRGDLARAHARGGRGAPCGRGAPRDPARSPAREARRHRRDRLERRRDRARPPHGLQRLLDGPVPDARARRSSRRRSASARAIFTTIHSYTSAHRLADVPAEDKRRGRAAAENIIPQASRSPAMLLDLLPELAGRLIGLRDERAGLERLGRGPRLLAREARHGRRDQRGVPRAPPRPTAGAASSTSRTPRSSPPTSPARPFRRPSTRSRR